MPVKGLRSYKSIINGKHHLFSYSNVIDGRLMDSATIAWLHADPEFSKNLK
jgi:hypothetical protein